MHLFTKIVCTIGPTSREPETLASLMRAGMDVARLNFSHGDPATHLENIQRIRAVAEQVGKPVAILGDLQGPKLRVGTMQDGGVLLTAGETLILTTEHIVGAAGRVPVQFERLPEVVEPDDRILIDDGLLELVVTAVAGSEITTRVVTGGILNSNKGLNLPRAAISIPAITEKDREDLAFAIEQGLDWIALSFVRTAAEVWDLKAQIRQLSTFGRQTPVIAKIEKPEAVSNLEAILDAADAVMVARGDLGVEAGHEKVPLIQKRILREVKLRAKPAITATQMLDSMIRNPRPTRAEVSDVANAVLDGTDAVMLSGETSVGDYPVEAVRCLRTIIDEIEHSENYFAAGQPRPEVRERTYSSSIADAAAEIAENLRLAAIAVYTESGRSATLLSAQRPLAPIVGFSRNERVLGRLGLLWGVRPLYGAWVQGVAGVVEQTERELLRQQLARVGDDIVITFGMVMGNEPFETNVLKLHRLKGE